ncbi:MAG: ferritin-like domain-containing protein [Burkholderiales bacterium]
MAQQLIPASAAELFAHALAIEREALSRYHELADWMQDLGIERVEGVFRKLEQSERAHLDSLERSAAGLDLPEISPWEYAWFFTSSPACLELAFPLMPQTPRDALALACVAERRAEEFFLVAANCIGDAGVIKLAVEMALEQHRRVSEIERALRVTPDPRLDWDLLHEAGVSGAGLHGVD